MPDPAWVLYTDSTGQLECRNEDLEQCIAFDSWREYACEHEGGILVHHYIGNIARVAAVRELLSQNPKQFPIILNHVIYNGIHCGDQLSPKVVHELLLEIKELPYVPCPNTNREELLQYFESQLTDLVNGAITMNKPILF